MTTSVALRWSTVQMARSGAVREAEFESPVVWNVISASPSVAEDRLALTRSHLNVLP